jgi:hypothetical protein
MSGRNTRRVRGRNRAFPHHQRENATTATLGDLDALAHEQTVTREPVLAAPDRRDRQRPRLREVLLRGEPGIYAPGLVVRVDRKHERQEAR